MQCVDKKLDNFAASGAKKLSGALANSKLCKGNTCLYDPYELRNVSYGNDLTMLKHKNVIDYLSVVPPHQIVYNELLKKAQGKPEFNDYWNELTNNYVKLDRNKSLHKISRGHMDLYNMGGYKVDGTPIRKDGSSLVVANDAQWKIAKIADISPAELEQMIENAYQQYHQDLNTLNQNSKYYQDLVNSCVDDYYKDPEFSKHNLYAVVDCGLDANTNIIGYARAGALGKSIITEIMGGIDKLKSNQANKISVNQKPKHSSEVEAIGGRGTAKTGKKGVISVISEDSNRSVVTRSTFDATERGKKYFAEFLKNRTAELKNDDSYLNQYPTSNASNPSDSKAKEAEVEYAKKVKEYEQEKAKYDREMAQYERELAAYNQQQASGIKQGLNLKDASVVLVYNKLPSNIKIEPVVNRFIYDQSLGVKKFDEQTNELQLIANNKVLVKDKNRAEKSKTICINAVGKTSIHNGNIDCMN